MECNWIVSAVFSHENEDEDFTAVYGPFSPTKAQLICAGLESRYDVLRRKNPDTLDVHFFCYPLPNPGSGIEIWMEISDALTV